MVTTSQWWLLSIENVASVTEKLNFKFYLNLTNSSLRSYLWLWATLTTQVWRITVTLENGAEVWQNPILVTNLPKSSALKQRGISLSHDSLNHEVVLHVVSVRHQWGLVPPEGPTGLMFTIAFHSLPGCLDWLVWNRWGLARHLTFHGASSSNKLGFSHSMVVSGIWTSYIASGFPQRGCLKREEGGAAVFFQHGNWPSIPSMI